jgi:tripartite-type tricarboxylate transporter receptor subunit TctC
MKTRRMALARARSAGHAKFVALLLAGFAQSAISDNYPSRPIQLVNSTQSASTEVAVRAWVDCVSGEKLANQAIVVQDKPGANGVVAASFMRQQPNDGYTIMLSGMSNTTITPFTFKNPPYDPEKEFEGAAMFGMASLVMVANLQSGIRDIDSLKRAAAAAPKGIDIAVPSIAGAGHMLAAAVVSNLKLKAELVPTKGEAGAVTLLLGGEAPLSVLVEGTALPQVRGGRLVPVLVFAEKRLASMPQVPTVTEALGEASLAHSAWIGITTKAGGPPEVVKALERWTRACMDDRAFTQALTNAGFTPRFVSASDYARVVREDISFWRAWIVKLGIVRD